MENGPNLGLLVDGPQGSQHYQELMHMWRGLDALIQSSVVSVANDPPAEPDDGDVYIVGDTATGAWETHEHELARWSEKEETWEFYTAKEGWLVYNRGTSRFALFDGAAWSEVIAANIGVLDAGEHFAVDNLEAVLAEIGTRLEAIEAVVNP